MVSPDRKVWARSNDKRLIFYQTNFATSYSKYKLKIRKSRMENTNAHATLREGETAGVVIHTCNCTHNTLGAGASWAAHGDPVQTSQPRLSPNTFK